MKTLIFGFILAASLPLSARSFTSADGKRTMEAELFSYTASTNTVVLQIAGQNTRTTAKASAFSDQDQEYFKEFAREAEKFNALRVSSKEEADNFEDDKGLYIYEKRKQHFIVNIENRGDFDMEELTAKYDIYLHKFDKDGKKFVDTVSGQSTIESISANDSEQFETSAVEINIDCSTTSSCPKCVKQASAVERERVIGTRVQIYNSEDELLTEYHSSISTKTIANKEDSGD